VNEQLQWLIVGAPVGCVYALVAVGLVLTYKTSGVFNLGFSAQAFVSGAVFYVLVSDHDWPLWAGFVVSALVLSPLLGLLLDRGLFRYMRTAPWQVKLVTSLGLLIALPEITQAFIGQEALQAPPSVAPLFGFRAIGPAFPSVFGTDVSTNQLTTAIVTVVAVVFLGLLFRFTAIGLQMRAVVESPRMVELAGVNADRVSTSAWMLSSTLAGIAGVLLAPLYSAVDAQVYMLVIVAAIAAAAIGRFDSIPLTFVGGIALGIGERALPDIVNVGSDLAQDIRPSFPFIVLFVLLVAWPRLREKREERDPLAGVDPPPAAATPEFRSRRFLQISRRMELVSVAGFVAVMMTLVSQLWVIRLTDAFALAVIFLSITVVAGLGGQISLAQATFAAFGGFTLANLAKEQDVPVMLAMVIGALVAAACGALFVLLVDGPLAIVGRLLRRPFGRLSGLYLSLATLAFALMAERVIFAREEVSGARFGIDVARPGFAHSDRVWFLVVFGAFVVVAYIVSMIRKGTTGRYLAALRGSETAAESMGVNPTELRITMFALSAGIAGLGGGLWAIQQGTVEADSTYPALLGVVWVVLVMIIGSRTVTGALTAAVSLVVLQWLLETLGLPTELVFILFGLSAVTYARDAEGVLELQLRKGVLASFKQRALARRASALAAAGRLPRVYRPAWRAAGPVLAGPLLYTGYVLLRSLIEGHWVTVHSATLLVFIAPSVVFGLGWIVSTERTLRREGRLRDRRLLLALGALAGSLAGAGFYEWEWVPRASLADCVLVGVPAGFVAVAFFLLPAYVDQVARSRGWSTSPITWKQGRLPLAMLLLGGFLFFRTSVTDTSTTGFFADKGFPPEGWPVFIVVALIVASWVYWVWTVQLACNELTIGDPGLDDAAVAMTIGGAPMRLATTEGAP
jgi:branched-chain amino acid transport system permease protein